MMTCVNTEVVDELCKKQKATLQSTDGLNGHSSNGIHHRPTPPVEAMLPASFSDPKLSTMVEEPEEMLDEPWDNELSAEAQAHNISMFLSSGSDSGEEPEISETVITDVYRDPLNYCMEGIEDLATSILRTGRLTINGEPGDMTKLQPAIFNLQASEKEMPQLIPQMLQNAFFNHADSLSITDADDDDAFITVNNLDEALANGHIRLAIPVDTAIYVLLRSHSARNARQAEELIDTTLNGRYINNPASILTMPSIVKFQSQVCRPNSLPSDSKPLMEFALQPSTRGTMQNKNSTSSLSATEEMSTTGSSKLSTYSSLSNHYTSSSSLPRSEGSDTNRRDSGDSLMHQSKGVICSSGSTLHGDTIDEEVGDGATWKLDQKPKHPSLVKTASSEKRLRKHSGILQPLLHRSRGDSTGSDTSLSESRFIPGWNTGIFDNTTIIAQHGGNHYPLVWWEPSFKIDFRMKTSVGLLSNTVTGINPSEPEVTLKVFNSSAKQIGFAIRSYSQSTVFSSKVVYPTKGLKVLGPYKNWEDTVEFFPNNPNMTEMFAVELFFCTMDAKPVWNVTRRYAIMKTKKCSEVRRISRRRISHLQLPGMKEQKEDSIKLVLSHGLQCVVKGKLAEAEIIFSQALYLPDFQRVPIKAFVYICLAVIANKRVNQGHSMSLKTTMEAVEASSKLVNICEQGPAASTKMPRTIQLVKQLKKELNMQKILMKEKQKRGNLKRTASLNDKILEHSNSITTEGGDFTFAGIQVTVPPGAVSNTTNISFSSSDTKHLMPMLKASGWAKIVQVVTALHVECSPPIDTFNKAIEISTIAPEEAMVNSHCLVRLMHSNYLRHWQDVTDNALSGVTLSDGKIHMKTNLTGWLAVSVIQFDASLIAQMVLKSISIEPILLRLSVYCYHDTERGSVQIAVFLVPCDQNDSHSKDQIPENFVPASFPHTFQAYPNEKLRLEMQGNFEPDVKLGDTDLLFEVNVQNKYSNTYTKWVKMTSVGSDQLLCGKLSVSMCRNQNSSWENIAHVSLAMRSGGTSSSSSDH